MRTNENKEVMNQLAEQFLADKAKKTVFSNFKIDGNKLVYNSRDTVEIRGGYSNGKADFDKVDSIISAIESGEYELHSDYNLADIKAQLKKARIDKSSYVSTFKYAVPCTDTIAVKLSNGLVIGNSSILKNVGKTVAYGNVNYNDREALIQRILSEKISMVPFSVFDEAKLDITTLKIIDQSGSEKITVKERIPGDRYRASEERTVTRHFTGATVFECDGKQFLFDVDRNELEHKIFNAFLVELPRKVKTVADAYDSLKPQVVKDAIAKGLDVKRQGEWFFIPCAAPKLPKLSQDQAIVTLLRATGTLNDKGKLDSWRSERNTVISNLVNIIGKDRLRFLGKQANRLLDSVPRSAQLKTGDNRPNAVECVVTIKGVTYVKGKVSHTGREHKDLQLKTWHKAVANSATKSFTIIGDVD